MKHILAVLVFTSFSIVATCQAQAKFEPGWYVVQSSANYAVISASSMDIEAFGGKTKDVDLSQLSMQPGETVLAFDKSGDKTFCFDPYGRMIVFSGEASLNKGLVKDIASVGKIKEAIVMLSGSDIQEGAFVWIVGQDVAKSTVSIQVQGDKIIEIPQSKVELFGKFIREVSKAFEFRKAQ